MKKYINYRYYFSGKYGNLEHDYYYVKLLKHELENPQARLLFILDYVPEEDLYSGRMLSGTTGELFNKLIHQASKTYGVSRIQDFDYLVCTFNAFKTVGESKEFQHDAEKLFRNRIIDIINKYKPDRVITFGFRPYYALNNAKIKHTKGKPQAWLNVPIKTEINNHKFIHFPLLSLDLLVNCNYKGDQMYLAGYVMRGLANILYGQLIYKIPKLDYKVVFIDTLPKFQKLLDILRDQQVVSIDTESTSLNRIKNSLLTIQFAKCAKYAYILPFAHKNSPFDAREIAYIRNRLRNYFEIDNNNDYHVYTNAQFDLNMFKNCLGVRFYKTDIWDIFAGEYCSDENLKFLKPFTGYYYYSLFNISMQYGCTAFMESEFGKEQRATISETDLNENVLEYMSLDVIIPYLIHKAQIEKAHHLKHKKYELVVRKQISDIIHDLSSMEFNGILIDINYLFYLKLPGSPINQEIQKIEDKILNTEATKKANKILLKRYGVPAKGLFGDTDRVQKFDITKNDHKDLLFFNVLKLTPLDIGESGKGRLDKKFQKTYSKIEEVALFSELNKAKKLRDSYVNQFIKLWGRDEDVKTDTRIRPHFEYLSVVTGRTSENNPSLHQIPSRSELGNHIKRIFIASPGCLFVKVDFSAHEVRGWAIISKDNVLCELFRRGEKLRKQFKFKPSKKLVEKIDTEGDVHKLNAQHFFSIPVTKVSKELRFDIKAVVFGLIYGRTVSTLAEFLDKSISYVDDLVNKFLYRFPKGVRWFDNIEAFARKRLFVESPLGRRRYLWGYLLPESSKKYSSVISSMNRRARNSPIQGMCSDLAETGNRLIEKLKWRYYQKTQYYPYIKRVNAVHDSSDNEVGYKDIMLAIKIIDYAMTEGVKREVKKRFDYDMPLNLEIDFEIGPTLKDMKSWDFSLENLSDIIYSSLKFQKETLNYDLDVDKVHRHIMEEQIEFMPEWLQYQVGNKIEKNIVN